MLTDEFTNVKTATFIAVLVFILFPQIGVASNAQWIVWKKNRLQSVSYRPANVEASNKLIEIKATATVNSNLSGLLSFIQDVNNTQNWLVNTVESKIIKQHSKTEMSSYIKLIRIWPVKPRVLIIHSTHWQNPDLSIEIKLSDYIPDINDENDLFDHVNNDKYFRVDIHSAHWTITPRLVEIEDTNIKKAEIFIEYTFIADGKGEIPNWLADHLSLKSIWKTMNNIRQQLPDTKWQQMTVEGITELSETNISQ